MGLRSVLSKPLAAWVVQAQRRWSARPAAVQEAIFRRILQQARHTRFGRDHGFEDIASHADFVRRVPLRDYEGLSDYVGRILKGERDVLWPGLPLYFAKTSGTTSGTKFIPITRDSISNHINSARNALLSYIGDTGRSGFLDGKLIFLSGSPELEQKAGIPTGRLSGIVNHHVPAYLRGNQVPSYATNCIEDWETKLEHIIDETLHADMRLISGIPPWVQMYFDRITARTGKNIGEVFPSFSLLVYGGVNFAPYRKRLFDSIGRAINTIETYPASEGFIAYQDRQGEEGMLLALNSGIFYEFIPVEEFFSPNPVRLTIGEVELDKNYALVINSNAGLWGYSIGDTVKFVSNNPYRLLVTGRIKHFISAFGEHVIGEEVEKALHHALSEFPEAGVIECTVAPQVSPSDGLPHHEWYVEFSEYPRDMHAFEQCMDDRLRALNSYYDDLIAGKVLSCLKVVPLEPGAFRSYMKSIGKLGGQNKVPRLSNDRAIAEALQSWRTRI
jgi:hypothetical protein